MRSMVTVAVSMPAPLAEELRSRAEVLGISVSAIVRMALKSTLGREGMPISEEEVTD